MENNFGESKLFIFPQCEDMTLVLENFVELLYYKIQWQGSSIANDAVVVIGTEKHVNASIGTFGN